MKSGALARLLGSTVLSQAFLSGGGFLVAFILLRLLGAEPYGMYVLVSVTLLLLATLQGSFFLVTLVLKLADSNLEERRSLVGRLMRANWQVFFWLSGAALLFTALAWWQEWLTSDLAGLALAGIFAGLTVLRRELYRGVLLARHRTGDVLIGDIIYVALWVAGSVGATYLPMATAFAIGSMGIAAWVSGSFMARALWRFEPWSLDDSVTVWRDVSTQNAWSVFGAAVHWSFNQGYTYVVVAMLDVRAVAALAATRLFLMPVNMLSSGVTQSLFPLVSRWNQEVTLNAVFRRVVKICAALIAASMVYVLIIWWAQPWLFGTVLRQSFDQGKLLLLLWSAVFLLTLARDQIGCILLARSRLRTIGQITFASAGLALLTIWLAIPVFGPAGALLGIIVGEVFNLLGLLALLVLEQRRDSADKVAS